MSLEDWIAQSCPAPSAAHAEAARARQNQLTKPRGALGQLERIAIELAACQSTDRPSADRARIALFAGDHGVTAQGISAYPSAVTVEMLKNFARGGAAISVLARELDAPLEVITWRLRASGEKDQVTRPHRTELADARKGSRQVYFNELGSYVETSVYDHYRLPVGEAVKGPAIVEQRESTAVVGPSGVFHVDANGNLIINIR